MTILEDFKKFALRGNLLDLAIGFTVGAAFTTVAKSLVTDIIMPPVGLLTGGTDFADRFFLLKAGREHAPPYATLQDAQEAGAVTINYGLFINSVVALLLVAVVMFMVIRMLNKMDKALDEHFDADEAPKAAHPENKKCSYCRQTIDYEATRCPFCTSEFAPATAKIE